MEIDVCDNYACAEGRVDANVIVSVNSNANTIAICINSRAPATGAVETDFPDTLAGAMREGLQCQNRGV